MTLMCCDCGTNLDDRIPHKSWCPVERNNVLSKQIKLVADWKDVPPGTAVIVTKDDGTEVSTKTRSHAQLLSGHTAVIWVNGIVGCYCLDRVRFVEDLPVEAKPTESDMLDLLRKLQSGEGGKRTGELKQRGWLTWEVTAAGKAVLEHSNGFKDPT